MLALVGLPIRFDMNYNNVLHVYRFMSIFISFIFYLLMDNYLSIINMILVLLLILSSSLLIVWLYERAKDVPWKLNTLLIIETVGITLLLLPSGGLNGIFVWYALNPVLLAAHILPLLYCWLYLSFYLLFLYYFSAQGTLSLSSALLYGLAYILITLAVQLFSVVLKELKWKNNKLDQQSNHLSDMNKKLNVANQKAQQGMDHIMDLYKILEGINSHESYNVIIQNFLSYARRLTDCTFAFYLNERVSREGGSQALYTNPLQYSGTADLGRYLIRASNLYSGSPKLVTFNSKKLVIVGVTTSFQRYGILGVEIEDANKEELEFINKQLSFLGKLCAITYERISYEEVNSQLLLLEEQNRIANEIHDSVSQRLFSINYAMHAINQGQIDEEIRDKLLMVEEFSREAATELRKCIYKLSSTKQTEMAFGSKLIYYLDHVAELNDITIRKSICPSLEDLSMDTKRVIYRIVVESIGNAIRHGKATVIEVNVNKLENKVHLFIEDNGTGFDVEHVYRKGGGLGIKNVRELANQYNGKHSIVSHVDVGTKVKVTLNVKRSGDINEVVSN